jgi:NADPH:quinone reductase-like Zn-dependent oxidoreductase
MPSNEAVWLPAKRADLALGPVPETPPGVGEIVVENRAVAINPIDWLLQSVGDIIFPWLKYPLVLGSDCAGEVVGIGADVTRFKVGDRILGHAVGSDKARNRAAEGGFQTRTILLEHMAAPIPDGMAFADAAVLPLGLSTAACALFQKDQLGLAHPSASPAPQGRTVIVWGGSTSVGGNAIQLAVAAGYEVFATASPRNFDYLKGLGASEAFDYGGATVRRDMIAALDGRTIAGAVAIGAGSARACLDIVHACRGDKVIAMATPPVSFESAPRGAGRTGWLIPNLTRLIAANVSLAVTSRARGVRMKFIFGSSIKDNEVSGAIYRGFVPAALASGRYRAAPEPMVVGHGLAAIPAAVELQKKGVSAKKVVVTL